MTTDEIDFKLQPVIKTPRWQPIALLVAGLQCVIWGVFIVTFPVRSALAYGLSEPPRELFLWQGTGLVIVLFGVGYLIASTNPPQHWGIILVGFLSKFLGPVGITWSVFLGEVPERVLYLIPINDLIWLLPFAVILLQTSRRRRRITL